MGFACDWWLDGERGGGGGGMFLLLFKLLLLFTGVISRSFMNSPLEIFPQRCDHTTSDPVNTPAEPVRLAGSA